MKKIILIASIFLLAAACNKQAAVQPVPAPAPAPAQGQPAPQPVPTSTPSVMPAPTILTYQGNGFSFTYPAKAALHNYATSGAKLPPRPGLGDAVVDVSDAAFWQINRVSVVKDLSPASISKLFNAVPESNLIATQVTFGGVSGLRVTVTTIPNRTWYYAQTSYGIFEIQVENDATGAQRAEIQKALDSIQNSLTMQP